jgi:hypothetical protein
MAAFAVEIVSPPARQTGAGFGFGASTGGMMGRAGCLGFVVSVIFVAFQSALSDARDMDFVAIFSVCSGRGRNQHCLASLEVIILGLSYGGQILPRGTR